MSSQYSLVRSSDIEQIVRDAQALQQQSSGDSGELQDLLRRIGKLQAKPWIEQVFLAYGAEEGSDPATVIIPPGMKSEQASDLLAQAAAKTVALTLDGRDGDYFSALQSDLAAHGIEITQDSFGKLDAYWDVSTDNKQPAKPAADDPDWVKVIFVTDYELAEEMNLDPMDPVTMTVYLDEFKNPAHRRTFLWGDGFRLPPDLHPLPLEFKADDVSDLVVNGFATDIAVRYPRASRYGVPEAATDRGAAKLVQEQMGLWIDPADRLEVHTRDTGDDTGETFAVAALVPRAYFDFESHRPAADAPRG